MNRHRLAAVGAVVAIGAAAVITPNLVDAGGAAPAGASASVERSGEKQSTRDVATNAVPDATATADPSLFVPITPFRMYDSRLEVDPWLPGQYATYNATTDFEDVPQIPAGVSGVTYNVTIVTISGAGFVQILTPGGELGGTSTVNWTGAGQFVANGGSVGLVADGLEIYVGGTEAAAVDIIIDVTGYYIESVV